MKLCQIFDGKWKILFNWYPAEDESEDVVLYATAYCSLCGETYHSHATLDSLRVKIPNGLEHCDRIIYIEAGRDELLDKLSKFNFPKHCEHCGENMCFKEEPKTSTEITGETSDGYHTFNELYHHRAILFSVIVSQFKELAWKARYHYDGTMFDGMFIVGINTLCGQATYHYDFERYWGMFDCKELENAPEWDGHTPDQAIARIASLRLLEPFKVTKE